MPDTPPPERGVERTLPEAVGLNAEFYGHCATGRLHIQRCSDCAAWRHPPRYRCPECGSDAWTWEPSSQRGRVYTWTITHRAVDPFFADRIPYAVVVVETEEGVRLVGNTSGIGNDDLALDLPVRIHLVPVDDRVALLEFGPGS
ncbi:MAG: OB-fold domain-containing protein [Acidimicrobiia bacterium]